MSKIVLNDDELKELYNKLRVVVTVNDAKYLLKRYTLEELKKKAFLRNKSTDKEEYLDNSEIEVVDMFNYIQEGNNPFCFNPTICNILENMPKNCMIDANAFEVENTIYQNNQFLSKVTTYKIRKK